MSIELVADVDTVTNWKAVILDRLKSDAVYEQLTPPDANTVQLRIAEHPRRDSWQEDVTIRFEKGRIWVAFHSGNRDERAALIHLLESTLRQAGCQNGFVED